MLPDPLFAIIFPNGGTRLLRPCGKPWKYGSICRRSEEMPGQFPSACSARGRIRSTPAEIKNIDTHRDNDKHGFGPT